MSENNNRSENSISLRIVRSFRRRSRMMLGVSYILLGAIGVILYYAATIVSGLIQNIDSKEKQTIKRLTSSFAEQKKEIESEKEYLVEAVRKQSYELEQFVLKNQLHLEPLEDFIQGVNNILSINEASDGTFILLGKNEDSLSLWKKTRSSNTWDKITQFNSDAALAMLKIFGDKYVVTTFQLDGRLFQKNIDVSQLTW